VAVPRARAVAALAAHADLRPGGGIAVLGRVVVLAKPGGVAVGAHEVPVVLRARPVQFVPGRDTLTGLEVEPALAALFPGARIPGHRERLQAAARQLYEILLERGHPKGVLDLEVRRLPIGPLGADDVLPVGPATGGLPPLSCEAGAAQTPALGPPRRRLHGRRVLRAFPALELIGVAAGAGLAADEGRRRDPGRHRGPARPTRGPPQP